MYKLIIFLLHRFKNLPSSAFKIPPLAYNCSLYELKPSAKTGWSNESYILFSNLMSEKTGTFFMYVMKTDGERIEVDVVWKECSYPLSIRNAMFYLGHGACEGYINSEVVRIHSHFPICNLPHKGFYRSLLSAYSMQSTS